MRTYFPTLVGNDDTARRLGDAIRTGTLPHAHLIAGPAGSGRHTLARGITAALNCENLARDDLPLPCGICNTCRRIREGNFTDVKLLGRTDGRATIGVDDVRAFREDMFLSATESAHKVYIIEDFDTATPQAQNALLKVLEEPPPGVVILLLADGCEKILTTIQSRAQLTRMHRLEPSAIEEYLLRTSPDAKALKERDPEGFRAAVLHADGKLGAALADISGKENEATKKSRAVTEGLIRAALPGASYLTVRTAVLALPSKRTELSDALDEVLLALRDLLLVKCHAEGAPLFYTSRSTAEEVAALLTKKRILRLFDLFSETAGYNRQNGNINAILADLAAKLKTL
ncbi:MAG TPA: hypothetical protein DDY70_07025 [Clostridiales bacterium]|nr:hypothetical protein [Clostridiales bacterium]